MLWMVLEQALKREKLMWDPLDRVETVNTEEHLTSTKLLLEAADGALRLSLLELIEEAIRRDANREGSDVCSVRKSVIVVDAG